MSNAALCSDNRGTMPTIKMIITLLSSFRQSQKKQQQRPQATLAPIDSFYPHMGAFSLPVFITIRDVNNAFCSA